MMEDPTYSGAVRMWCASVDCYEHLEKTCVWYSNIETYDDKSVDQCKVLCSSNEGD